MFVMWNNAFNYNSFIFIIIRQKAIEDIIETLNKQGDFTLFRTI